MSRARLIVTAVTVQGLTQAQAARQYGLSESRVSRLMTRWRAEGDAALEPRSRRPKTSPTSTSLATVGLIVNLRANLRRQGLDHGSATIVWHLAHHHGVSISRSTVARILTREGLVLPEPKKRPRASYLRFEAAMPNECWQSDFTHHRLADGDIEILTFLDDCTRYAISVTAHRRVTTPAVVAAFRTAVTLHGAPASTLTDNGMVFTVRLAGWGRQGGRNAFEHELDRLGIQQKNGSPAHPQTQGKVERFQPHHATPAARYQTLPKATPRPTTDGTPHDRVRRDRIDQSGTVTIRIASRLRHIGIGRAHAGTAVLILARDLDITVINAATGELLRELTIDPEHDYQPRGKPKG